MALITAFTQDFAQGITLFLPAFKQLLAIIIPAMAVLLLGVGLIVQDNRPEPLLHRGILSSLGEGLMLLAGLVMAAGSVFCWWKMFLYAKLVSRDDKGQL